MSKVWDNWRIWDASRGCQNRNFISFFSSLPGKYSFAAEVPQRCRWNVTLMLWRLFRRPKRPGTSWRPSHWKINSLWKLLVFTWMFSIVFWDYSFYFRVWTALATSLLQLWSWKVTKEISFPRNFLPMAIIWSPRDLTDSKDQEKFHERMAKLCFPF